MRRYWIVVGDTTSSCGRVITGSPFTDIEGAAVARVGDHAVTGVWFNTTDQPNVTAAKLLAMLASPHLSH
jgi:uncharacterized Zn-binding protein involved in type VI secretion